MMNIEVVGVYPIPIHFVPQGENGNLGVKHVIYQNLWLYNNM